MNLKNVAPKNYQCTSKSGRTGYNQLKRWVAIIRYLAV